MKNKNTIKKAVDKTMKPVPKGHLILMLKAQFESRKAKQLATK